MLPTPNMWSGLLALQPILDANSQLEKRMENNASGQVLYIGYTGTPNANQAAAIWFIVKISYDSNGFIDYYQLPLNGAGFFYAWNDRATYF